MVEHGPDLDALGAFVRRSRHGLGLTQTQLAGRVGWAQEQISLLENGKYGTPSLPLLARLAGSLETTLGEVLRAAGYADAGSPPMTQSEAEPQSGSAFLYTLQRLLDINATNLKDLLNQASDLLAEAMGAEKLDLMLYDATSQSLVAVGSSNTPMGMRQRQIGLDRLPLANGGHTIEVFRSGRPYITGHADLEPEFIRGLVEGLGVKSAVEVPMIIADTIRGVLSAQSSQIERFTNDDLRFFQVVARWIGTVTNQAELAEAITRDAAETARRSSAEELMTVLAHDLGNHLTPLKGHIDMMRNRARKEGRERDEQNASAASAALDRVRGLVNDLLDASRLERDVFALTPEPTDVVALAEDVVQEMRTSDISIHLRAPNELQATIDAARICQALDNLVANAIRHSPQGAPVSIEIEEQYREDGPWIVITVRDDGPGIAPDVLPRLFQRFVTGPGSGGLGLGLYLARGVAEAHGGTLTVDSTPGHGAAFRLTVPRGSQ